MQWFEVDKQGLARLLERRGKEFVLYELIQNAWDENTSKVHIALTQESSRRVRIEVADDNPNGFADLSHAFTLFADSIKRNDAEKRGRFNLGEKLVLALCDEARIESTTGTIIFSSKGRSKSSNKRDSGSVFVGWLRMAFEELEHCEAAVHKLIPPSHIETVFNGSPLIKREPLATFEASLPTEIADQEGNLRRTVRKCSVEVYEPLHGEIASIYEMGIPIVETTDRYHINVMQKVPLNFDRDNVTPAYLAQVRALVLEYMEHSLTSQDANATWARDALERHGDELPETTINKLVDLRFGEKRVAYDPSDPEANSLAVAKGYHLVYGSQLSSAEWSAVKRAGAILPAGQVTPSPKPFSPDGEPLKLLSPDKYTDGVRWVVGLAERVGKELLGTSVHVKIANDMTWPFNGCFTVGGNDLTINVGRLGYKWFVKDNLREVCRFLIHEFGHRYEGNHLSDTYHDALCGLGAKLAVLALTKPEVFE